MMRRTSPTPHSVVLWRESAFRSQHLEISIMDYLTIALILFTIGVVMLLAEILLPTGGSLVVLSLLFFAMGVGIILAQGTTTEAVVAMAGLALGLPAAGFVAVSAWRRMSIGSILPDDSTAPGTVLGSHRAGSPQEPNWQDRLPDAAIRYGGVRRQAC